MRWRRSSTCLGIEPLNEVNAELAPIKGNITSVEAAIATEADRARTYTKKVNRAENALARQERKAQKRFRKEKALQL